MHNGMASYVSQELISRRQLFPLAFVYGGPIYHLTALQTSVPHFVRQLFIRLQGVMCKTVKYDSCSYIWL